MLTSEEIYERVEKYRKERGITVNKLSELVGISHSTLNSWKIRGTMPKLDVLDCLCYALGIPLVALLYDVNIDGLTGEEIALLAYWKKINEEQRKEFKNQIAEYHKYYNLIHFGDLYRTLSPFEEKYKVAWQIVSQDKKECLLTVVCLQERIPENFIYKFKGLDQNAYYKNEEDGKVYSGDFLANVGLNLSNKINYVYGSRKWYFIKVD